MTDQFIRRAQLAAWAIILSLSALPSFADSGEMHHPFDSLLKKYVQNGATDYAGFAGDRVELDHYLEILAGTDPSQFDRQEKLAFWLNAYNAFTIKLILNHYPGLESIRDIPRGDRWKWTGWVVNGAKVSLDEIEHKILRPMGDPRIHFAINCASYSCPPLAGEAYEAETVDSQLEDAASIFLADSTRGLRIADEKGNFGGTNHVVYLSEIFHWFESDFKDAAGTRIDFIIPHTDGKVRQFLTEHRYDLKVKKLKYNWSLNDKQE